MLSSLCSNFGKILGKGPLGTVYTLKNEPNKVVKVIRLTGLTITDKRALMSRLHVFHVLVHPNILQYRDILYEDELVFISSNTYKMSLERIQIDRKTYNLPFTDTEILEVARQVTSALVYLHNPSKIDINGDPLPLIIHQNLKPSNILTTEDMKHFVVADPLVPIKSSDLTINKVDILSPYVAPEIHLYNKYTHKSDMWSLGVIILELATLKKPSFIYDSDSVESIGSNCLSDLSKVQSPIIQRLIERLLVLNPEERPSADTLLLELGGSRPDDIVKQCSFLIRQQSELQRQIDTLNKICSEYEQQKMQLRQVHIENQRKINEFFYNNSVSTSLSNDSNQLINAAKINNVPLVNDLVQKGIGIGSQDKEGMTALMHAAQRGHEEIVSTLVQYEYNLKTKNGMTALMFAAQNNRYKIVEILVEFESRAQNKLGKTALMLAVEKGHESIVKLLKTYEWNIKDKKGQTAEDIAWFNNRHDLAIILSNK